MFCNVPLHKISTAVLHNIKKFIVLFSLMTLGVFATAMADNHTGEEHSKQKFDASSTILGHVQDAYDWHFFDWNNKPVAIPLPVILYNKTTGALDIFCSSKFDHGHAAVNGYTTDSHLHTISRTDGQEFLDFSITKNVMSMLIGVALMLWMFLAVAKRYTKNGAHVAPKGFQNFLEMCIVFIRDEVAKPNIGHKYMKFMPLLLTFFFFIWINNMLGLLPGAANFTGNIAVTAALALVTFLVMLFSANKHFWGHLFNPPGVPMGINILLTIIEIISFFIKPIALMIRLFANILAGHIIILSIISMIFIFALMNEFAGWGFAPVSLAFTLFMYALELLVGAIQAFIFTNLSAVFIGQSVEEGHHHEEAHAENAVAHH
jgi:F-type H+-transporting ATPase subunit a